MASPPSSSSTSPPPPPPSPPPSSSSPSPPPPPPPSSPPPPSPSSSSPPPPPPKRHQVFLSFRGEDTRHNITAQLLEALEGKRLDVFFDEKKLEKGEKLDGALEDAITASNLSIIVLSKDYASSKSCLKELSHIIHLNRTQRHIIFSICYHVNPSDVENVGGSFKTSFGNYDLTLSHVKQWKDDFAEVGKLKQRGCRWHIDEKFQRNETDYVKEIVEHVIRKLNFHVFVSLAEDTQLNFTSHLIKALECTGINVLSDNEKLDPESPAIAASNLSIIVLSEGYASSELRLAKLSTIMGRRRKQNDQGHTVVPIFYHVNPSHVRHIDDGSFKKPFDDHDKKGLHQLKQWKMDFAEVGYLKGWHIEGGAFDRSDTEYINNAVEDVIKKLNSKSRSVSENLIGIDDQKETILGLVEREDIRIIGLWGKGGMGKTTLADAVYNELSPQFDDEESNHCFLHNVGERIGKQGIESLRNEFLSVVLKDKEIYIRTPSIGSIVIQDRLKNKRVLVVLDDVNDSGQIECMGVKHFAHGSKIIVTSRDRQVLKNGGAHKIHEVKKLNENESLQLFSTFAFKLLNPAADYLALSSEFVKYGQGNPLALKVLGSQLFTKTKNDWESELDKLKEYGQPKISQILKSGFDGLDELEKKIFLDIAIFFKGELKKDVEAILSSCYKGAVCGISNLVDKSLLEVTSHGSISMHDMLEEMGKDIIRQQPTRLGERRILWSPKDVVQVLKYNTGTELTEGIKLDMSQVEVDNLQLSPTVFEKMHNLKYIHLYNPPTLKGGDQEIRRLLREQEVSLGNELRYLCWEYFPFKSLHSSFNPKNLVVLKLRHGDMERLWTEDEHKDLVNLREIDLGYCKRLRKIPNLSKATPLKILNCTWCSSLDDLSCLASLEGLDLTHSNSLVELPCLASLERLDLSHCYALVVLPCLNHLTSLESLDLSNCWKLTEITSLSGTIMLKELNCSGCRSLVELPRLTHLTSLELLELKGCRSLKKFPEVSNHFSKLDLSETGIEEVPDSIEFLVNLKMLKLERSLIKNVSSHISNLKSLCSLDLGNCKRLTLLLELPRYLRRLNANDCTSLKEVSFADHNSNQFASYAAGDIDYCDNVSMVFSNCSRLNQVSIDNIVANAMLQIQCLCGREYRDSGIQNNLFCCLSGNVFPEEMFEKQSENSCLTMKISREGSSGSKFLAFAIGLVADLTNVRGDLAIICNYQLRAAGGKEFSSECQVGSDKFRRFTGDHMLILFSQDMVTKDEDYEEASFELCIKYSTGSEEIDVEKSGVHVFFVDAESDADI